MNKGEDKISSGHQTVVKSLKTVYEKGMKHLKSPIIYKHC